MDLWPSHLYVYLSQRRATPHDVSDWVRRNNPPVCAFMPDRLSDPAANLANSARFTTFSQLLYDNQMVRSAHPDHCWLTTYSPSTHPRSAGRFCALECPRQASGCGCHDIPHTVLKLAPCGRSLFIRKLSRLCHLLPTGTLHSFAPPAPSASTIPIRPAS